MSLDPTAPAPGSPVLPSRRLLPDAAALGLLAVAFAAFLAPLPVLAKAWINNACFLAFLLAGAWDAAVRGRREPGARAGWTWLRLGYLAASAGGVGMVVSLLLHGPQARVPSLVIFLVWDLALLFTGLGLSSFPRPTVERRMLLRSLLDAAVFALSMFILLWAAFLDRLLHATPLTAAAEIAVVVFFVGNAAILGVSAHVVTGGRAAWKGPLGAYNGAFLALSLLSIPWVEAMLQGTYHQAHPSRLVLMPVWYLLFLGGRLRWPEAGAGAPRMPLQDVLPFVPTFLAAGAVIALYLPGLQRGNRLGMGLFLALAILVMVRQLVTVKDVRERSQDLEGMVEVKSRDLAASQALILRTQRMNLVAAIGAGLAHDVNNLIGAAQGYTGLMLMAHQDGKEPDPQDLQVVYDSLTKAGQMTGQLLGFARQGGEATVALDLNAQVRGLQPLLAILVPKGLHLDVDPCPGRLEVKADPAQVDQVIVNLVSNAKDATAAGGRIRLFTAAEGDLAVLGVSDTGSGMPPEVAARVLDPFFTTKEPGKGTGLGLSSVNGVVQSLGGRLDLETEPGRGTTFTIRLPRLGGG